MLKWIVIGLIVWYLTRNFNRPRKIRRENNPKNIDMSRYQKHYDKKHDETVIRGEGDYIDYEELD